MVQLIAVIDPGPVWDSFSAGLKTGLEGLLIVLVSLGAIAVFRRIGGV